MSPELLSKKPIDQAIPLQTILRNLPNEELQVFILGQDSLGKGLITEFLICKGEWMQKDGTTCASNGRLINLSDASSTVLWQSEQGELFQGEPLIVCLYQGLLINDVSVPGMLKFSSFPTFCFYSQCITVSIDGQEIPIVFGLNNGKLYVTSKDQTTAILISSVATSFMASGSFLIYLTTSHESIYAPLTEIATVLSENEEANSNDLTAKIATLSSAWEKRRVERGSMIVTSIPSSMSVVLQMPRGNLETIIPRPLALEVIKSDIAK